MQFVIGEPTVMWRMRRADGLMSHLVIHSRSDGAMVMWFVNDRPLGFRDFHNWAGALQWSEQLEAQNWKAGWRLELEYDDVPDPPGAVPDPPDAP